MEIEYKSNIATNLSDPTSVWVDGNSAYVTSASNDKLVVFNISNPYIPTYTTSTSNGLSYPYSVVVSGNYVYVSSNNTNQIVVYNKASPSAPVSTMSVNNPYRFCISGNYAYLGDSNAYNLVIYNISNPLSPVLMSSTGGTGLTTMSGIYVSGDYAYVTSFGSNKLVIFNISDKTSPVWQSATTIGTQPCSVYVSGSYAYVLNRDTYPNSKLTVLNISNPTAPSIITTTNTNLDTAYDLYASGNYIYVSSNSYNKIVIFDISNPVSPVCVADESKNLSGPKGVFALGNYVYLTSNATYGLTIFETGAELVSSSSSSSSTEIRSSSSSSSVKVQVSSSSSDSSELAPTTTTTTTGTTTATTTGTTTTTTTPMPPLAVVKTSLYKKVNEAFQEVFYTDASDNEETKNQLFAHSFDFGTLSSGETSETIVIALNVPYSKAIGNIKLGLMDTGDLTFASNTFGITSSVELRDDIIPTTYFQGINTTELDTDIYNITIPNRTNVRSSFVYLNVKLPTNQTLGRGLVKFKWFFQYAT